MLARVRVFHRITWKSRYLASVAYDVTMCLCTHNWHYVKFGSVRKIVIVNARVLL